MAVHDAVKAALDGKEHHGKTHVHEIHYKRSANGGFHAEVHHHHGEPNASEGHAKTEPHILPDMEAAQGHMDHYMGDQPAFGEMQELPAAGGGAGGGAEGAEAGPPEEA